MTAGAIVPVLQVLRIGPGASLQDRGRPGHMHQGVPPGGPWSPAEFARALEALGGPVDAAALEIPLHGATFRALCPVTLSHDGTPIVLDTQQPFTLAAAPWAVQYLAVAGGFAAPTVLGGRGLLPVAGLGGALGRFVRAGDVLYAPVPTEPLLPPSRPVPAACPPEALTSLSVVVGPDPFPDAALDLLTRAQFAVSPVLDRTGTRLLGPALPSPPDAGLRASTPVVRGALQVTSAGTLVALGPDHPTTGGYPVIAVLTRAAQRALARVRPGGALRFVIDPGRAGPRGD